MPRACVYIIVEVRYIYLALRQRGGDVAVCLVCLSLCVKRITETDADEFIRNFPREQLL